MARNSTGTYSKAVPSFVSGTVIDSGDMNSQFDDIASEMTDSLSRSGKGGMTARLRGVDGTSALPAYAFTSETTLGLSRSGSGELLASSNGTSLQKWTATGVTIYQAGIYEKGLTVTNSTSNGAGTTSTGNGSGAGGVFTGGATGAGVTGAGGATSGNGGAFSATSGHGVSATGAGSGNAGLNASGPFGVIAVGTTNEGVVGTGAAGSVGGWFRNGTAASATVRQNAALLSNGDLSFAGTTNPNSTVAHTNALGPLNIPKAWGTFSVTSGGVETLNAGFNIASIAEAGGDTTVTLATAFSSANYAVLATVSVSGLQGATAYVSSKTTTAFVIRGLRGNDNTTVTGVAYTVDFVVFGAQSS